MTDQNTEKIEKRLNGSILKRQSVKRVIEFRACSWICSFMTSASKLAVKKGLEVAYEEWWKPKLCHKVTLMVAQRLGNNIV